jgi:hypothetical protein
MAALVRHGGREPEGCGRIVDSLDLLQQGDLDDRPGGGQRTFGRRRSRVGSAEPMSALRRDAPGPHRDVSTDGSEG